MDWKVELIISTRMIIAAILGAFIGLNRERQGSDAGVRTYMVISIGACAFSLISLHIPSIDPSRIAAQVVTGIGFLGAGVILQFKNKVIGLTTAATLWATASIGMATAFGMYVLATITTCLIYIMLILQQLPGWKNFTSRKSEINNATEQ